MQLYDVTVRLGGSLFNEVPVSNVTAAEVAVLKVVHGGDAVIKVAPKGEDNDRTEDEVRDHLQRTYGRALAGIKGAGTLNAILGVPGVPLPRTVPGVDSLPAPKRGRIARKDDLDGLKVEPAEGAAPVNFE